MFHKPKIKEELMTHKRYIVKMEEMVRLEVEELERLHENSSPDALDYETNEFVKFENKECSELRNIFPVIQRKSEIITIYSLLEYEINKVCEIFEHCIGHSVKIKDLRSNGIIDGSKRYLEKVVGAKFPVTDKSWKEIQNIQEIRNILVHGDGVVKTGNTKLIGYIKQSRYLSIYPDGKVFVKSGYTLHIIDVIIEFFDDLFLSFEDTNVTKNIAKA